MIITIDGPTASGKSTTAQLLAQKLGAFYLNSGFLYRALAYLLMRIKGIFSRLWPIRPKKISKICVIQSAYPIPVMPRVTPA